MVTLVSKPFERWARFVVRRPWPVLLVSVAFTAAFASQIPRIILDTTTEGFLHPDDPILVQYDEFRERFGRDDAVIIGIETENPFTFEFLERLRAFHEDLEKETPFVDEITSMLNARWTRGEEDQLLVEDLVEEWPRDESDLAELRSRVYANPLYLDNLINRDGRITTVLIDIDTFVQDGVDESGKPVLRYLSGDEQRQVIDAIDAVRKKYQGPGFEVYTAGVVLMADRLAFRIQQDFPDLTRRALGAMAVILLVLFGSIRAVVLPLLVVVSALLTTLGAIPVLGMTYQLPTQVVPLSLLAIGIGDSIHVLAMYYHFRREGRPTDDALVGAFAHAGPAILLTSLTTAGALLSFLSADIAPIANIGVLLPIGVLVAFAMTMTMLPALLLLLPERRLPKGQRSFVWIENGLKRAGLWAADHPSMTLAGAAVLLTLSIAGVLRIDFSHNPMRWFPEGDDFRESTLLLNDRLGGVVTVEVLFETGERDAVKNPALLSAIDDITTFNSAYATGADGETAAEPFETLSIGKTISIVDLLKEINRALNENRPQAYALPTDRDLVAQELLLFELSGSDDLEDLADYEYKTARMTVRAPWVDATRYGDFIDGLVSQYRERIGDLADVEVTGRVPVLARTISAVIQSMMSSYVLAFAAVVPLMILFLRSVPLGLVAMIPNLLPIVAALGLMGWIGVPLDLFSLLTGSITLGIAVDDTIHFMHGVRRQLAETADTRIAIERTLALTGQALFTTTLILCCGFALYTTAYMRNAVNFGIVTSFALAIALLADILVAPALVTLLAKRLRIGSRQDRG